MRIIPKASLTRKYELAVLNVSELAEITSPVARPIARSGVRIGKKIEASARALLGIQGSRQSLLPVGR